VFDANRPLRIVHCLWEGEVGGTQRAVYQLVREQLRDPAIEPAVLFAQARGPYMEAARELASPVFELDLSSGHALRELDRPIAALRPFDVHHFHSAEPLLMLASLRCRGACRVYTHRGGLIRYPARKRIQYALTGAMLRRGFHGLSGNTRHATRCASELFRIDPSAFRVTYNGVEFELLEPSSAANEARAELGLKATDFVLGTAAHLKPWKRMDRLLQALQAVQDPRLRLLVVGDGEDLPRLEHLAETLDLGHRVVFAGLRVGVGDYLQVMNAFCLPSTAMESFGNAAVEAMALGVPTIIFRDGGGMVEHIDSGQTGFVVADQQELAETIRRLLADTALAERVASRGRAAIRARYTTEHSAQAYKVLYASALGRGGERHA
jgi:glycosyltransferase involved in cell wall biosynthesis